MKNKSKKRGKYVCPYCLTLIKKFTQYDDGGWPDIGYCRCCQDEVNVIAKGSVIKILTDILKILRRRNEKSK